MGWLSLVPRLLGGSDFEQVTVPKGSGGGLAASGDPLQAVPHWWFGHGVL